MSVPQATDLEEQLVDAWRLLAAERFAGNLTSQESPQAIIVTGQPAAGKSVLIEALTLGPLETEIFARIDPSELADLHPARPVLLQNRDIEGVDSLRGDAAALASTLLDQTVEARSHLVLSCTFDGEASAEGLLGYLQESGYVVKVLAIAVEITVSRRDYLRRRAEQLQLSPHQNDLDASYHDSMHGGYLSAVSWLEESDGCDVTLIDRKGKVLAEKSAENVLAAGHCFYLLSTLADEGGAVDEPPAMFTGLDFATGTDISSESVEDANRAALRNAQFHPRFAAEKGAAELDAPNAKSDLAISRINFANVSDHDRRLIEKRLQYVQTLQRLAETEQHGGL